jgi:hypothetical protein
MEVSVKRFFERYEQFFRKALGGDMDKDEVASLYAPEGSARRNRFRCPVVQKLEGDPKIFGWVSADEQALLKQHGIG